MASELNILPYDKKYIKNGFYVDYTYFKTPEEYIKNRRYADYTYFRTPEDYIDQVIKDCKPYPIDSIPDLDPFFVVAVKKQLCFDAHDIVWYAVNKTLLFDNLEGIAPYKVEKNLQLILDYWLKANKESVSYVSMGDVQVAIPEEWNKLLSNKIIQKNKEYSR